MKLTTILIFLAVMQVSARSFGQRVTLSQKDAPLVQVFDQIRAQTGVDFMFTSSVLKDAKPVTIKVENVELKEVLAQIFNGQPLEYSIEDKTVVVSKKSTSLVAKLESALNLPVTVTGRVVDTTGQPLAGATVSLKGLEKRTVTDADGRFSMAANNGDLLVVTYVGYLTQNMIVADGAVYQFVLHDDPKGLKEVVVHTGYQALPRERASGSFEVIDTKKIDEQVSSNIFDRLNGTTSLLFDSHQSAYSSGKVPFTMRGLNTILGNSDALIVVDNFPYDGDFNNINPDDIESITLLKDASAASIWGARAGNGVVVITTKKGKFNQRMKVAITSSMTISDKPNLFQINSISSGDYINFEKQLFANGYYTSIESDPNHPYLSPVIEALIGVRDNKITSKQANSLINSYSAYDIRNDLVKTMQHPFSQRHALSISGGTRNSDYYISAGYSNDIASDNGTAERITLNANNAYKILPNLTVTTSFSLSQGTQKGGNKLTSNPTNEPYTRLFDATGNPLPVGGTNGGNHRLPWIDTIGSGKLQDWHYYPVSDLSYYHATQKTTNFTGDVQLNYSIFTGLDLNLDYQLQKQSSDSHRQYDPQSYYVRDLINTYSQIDPGTGIVTSAVPAGGILYTSGNSLNTNNLRGQLSFNHIGNKHQITALAGGEIRNNVSDGGVANQFFGYQQYPLSYTPVDYFNYFPTIFGGAGQFATSPIIFPKTTDHAVSVYGNAAYIYNDKYTFNVSARRDAENVLGVSTNNKWKPLWSAGFSWDIGKESFYHQEFLPSLKLRATYGVSGNINPAFTGATIFQVSNGGGLFYNNPFADVIKFANPDLKWEEVHQFNLGLDFSIKNARISGSLNYYRKTDNDLFGQAQVDITEGIGSTVIKNSAGMKSNGWDINLNSINLNGDLRWTTGAIFDIHHDKVTAYYLPVTTNALFVQRGAITPIPGQTIYAINAYRWRGLDPQTGEPIGILNGSASKDYNAILNTDQNLSDIKFNGSAVPTIFGSVNNNFSWKSFNLGFNITYKLGYYFMKPSINYSSLITSGSNSAGSGDYAKRWQKPGDENHTSVPSFIYPGNGDADYFYSHSEALVQKADNVRIQYVNFGYTLTRKTYPKLPVEQLSLTLNAQNLGIIWRANKDDIDPAAIGTYSTPKTYSLTLHCNF